MVSAAMLPALIHVAVPGWSGRGSVGRRSDGATWNDDVDVGIGGSGVSGGG